MYRKTDYLKTTLDSLYANMVNKENILVRVYNCDGHDLGIAPSDYPNLEIVEITAQPDLSNLESNYQDSPERIAWRSRQNFHYSEAFRLSHGLADYYMHIEDDVVACKGFDVYVFNEIEQLKGRKFSFIGMSGGFIGLIFPNENLLQVSGMLRTFISTMPCDFLIDHFRDIKTAAGYASVRTSYSIFQHIGVERTLPGGQQLIKFKKFLG